MVISLQKDILFEYLLENSQDIITLTDLNLNYIFISRAFLKTYNLFHSSQVIGKNMKNIIPTECFLTVKNQTETVIASREPKVCTFKLNSGKNKERILKRTSIPVVENSEITGLLSVSRDITNEENLKLKLVEKVYQLNTLLSNEKKLKAQKEIFMATLTHDLKNPVQAQLMSLKLLQTEEITKKEKCELIEELIESSNYMNGMLCSILQTYKLDNGIIELEKQYFDVEELIKKCINEVKALAKSNSIEIVCKFNINHKKLFGDSVQLRRVIGNIMNNSLHYGYKNTKLNIDIHLRKGNMVFDFENTSDEIPQDIKNHIFDKYVTNNKLSGAGLGLYFSKKVVEAHSGHIYLTANGNNNKFTFEIPLKQTNNNVKIKWE